MITKKRGRIFHFALVLVLCCAALMPVAAIAATPVVPGAADSSRVQAPDLTAPLPASKTPKPDASQALPIFNAPPGSEQITFRLNNVVFSGMSVYNEDDLRELFRQERYQDVTLAWVYELAARVTQKYRAAGYLLSYAYVPDQEIVDGSVLLHVVEGHINRVVIEGPPPAGMALIQPYFNRITRNHPIRENILESTLLRINDLPGLGYRAVLLPEPQSKNPADFVLHMVPIPPQARISAGFDNNASRFLGPHTAYAALTTSFLPLQQTSLYAQTSLPTDKFNFFSLTHAAALSRGWTVEGMANVTRSRPGFTLKSLDITSTSVSWGAAANYQILHQRDYNLLGTMGFEGRDVRSNFFDDQPLTRDSIRSIKAGLSYDIIDSFGGINAATFKVTKGVDGLGASKAGAQNLSRSAAKPDFLKLNMSASRLQRLDENWNIKAQVTGQMANEPLYASEEFGVGGAEIGRAYDPSDITGDEGAAAGLELRYLGFRTLQPVNFEPFLYYDIGFISNRDTGQPDYQSLASAGAGVRFATTTGQSGSITIAVPLTKDVTAPIYGGSETAPRIMLQFSQSF